MSHPKPGDERAEQHVADLDDDRKPSSPFRLTRDSWKYVLRRTYREFKDDNCPDVAAGLTYYAVLSIFPAALALISLLGVFGQGQKSVDKVLQVLGPLVSPEHTEDGAARPRAHRALAGRRSRAGDRARGCAVVGLGLRRSLRAGHEHRLRDRRGPAVLEAAADDAARHACRHPLVAWSCVMLIVSGPLADSIGDVIGLGSQAVTVWNIAKWPVIVLFVVLIVAILYYATPNVKQPGSAGCPSGACVAILVWVLASVGFAFYVATFGSYNKTYGSLAGADRLACCGCGSPTSRCCSALSSTPSSSEAASSRPASQPRRSSSSPPVTPEASGRHGRQRPKIACAGAPSGLRRLTNVPLPTRSARAERQATKARTVGRRGRADEVVVAAGRQGHWAGTRTRGGSDRSDSSKERDAGKLPA